jgi:hypothetical protein
MRHSGGDGALVVDYTKLAEALRKRDLDLMAKAEARALRQGATGAFAPAFGVSPERSVGGGWPVQSPASGGVAAALRMEGDHFGHSPSVAQSRARQPGSGAGLDAGRPSRQRIVAGSPSPASSLYPPLDAGGVVTSPTGVGRRGATGRSPVAARLGFGGESDAFGHSAATSQHQPPPTVSQHGDVAADGLGAAATLRDVLQACEAVDEERSGKLHAAQLLTCCRMRGVEESSSMLRAIISDVSGDDGRTDYVTFVQQLAAQRAGQSARDHVAQLAQA